MIACIDSGNSRIKWGIHDGRSWLASGAVDHASVDELGELPKRFSPDRVLMASVAGEDATQAIRQALSDWQPRLYQVASSAEAGGVRNLYQNPAQLGVDRWCALIGARQQTTTACLVVMAGTATTIDTLDDAGNFLGGLILPGLELMRRALARDTAALPLADGQHVTHPRRTDDAITSGCLEAQAGAIERAFGHLGTDAICLLSGGNALRLAPLLTIPHRTVDNLVLEGLRCLAQAG